MKFKLQFIADVLLATLVVSLLVAWHASRRDAQQLHDELQAAQKTIHAAQQREKDRDAAAAQIIAQMELLRSQAKDPLAILKALPRVLPLPESLRVLDEPTNSTENLASKTISEQQRNNADTATIENNQERPARRALPESPTLQMPAADLKPLYNFALDCQECRVRLQAAQGDLEDEKTRTHALERERDSALRLAHGGSAWMRVARAAKWFVIGAAAGYAASRSARH